MSFLPSGRSIPAQEKSSPLNPVKDVGVQSLAFLMIQVSKTESKAYPTYVREAGESPTADPTPPTPFPLVRPTDRRDSSWAAGVRLPDRRLHLTRSGRDHAKVGYLHLS